MTSTAATTTAQPTRATWKGHRNARQLMFFGVNTAAPASKGVRCMVGVESGQTVRLTDATTGKTVQAMGVASKFWAAPVTEADERKARNASVSKALAKAAKAPAKRTVKAAPAPAGTRPMGDLTASWAVGQVVLDGWTVNRVRGYYALLTRTGEAGAEWAAYMADGKLLAVANQREAKVAARAYGPQHGLVSAAVASRGRAANA